MLNTVSLKQLSDGLKYRIIKFHTAGEGYKKLSSRLGIPISTVRNIVKKWKERGSLTDKNRSGWPKKISERHVRSLLRTANASYNSSTHFATEWVTWSYHEKKALSSSTTQKKSIEVCERAYRLTRRLLEQYHVDGRDKNWIVWNNHNRYAWRKKNEAFKERNLIPTVKYGGESIML